MGQQDLLSMLFRTDRIFPYLLPSVFTIIFSSVFLTYTFKKERESQSSRFFAILCLLHLFSAVDVSLGSLMVSGNTWLEFIKLHYFIYLLILPVEIQFMHRVTGQSQRHWLEWTMYTIALAFFPSTFTEFYFKGSVEFSYGFTLSGGAGLYLLTLLRWGTMVYGAFLFYRFRSPIPLRQETFRWVFSGVLLGWFMEILRTFPMEGKEWYLLSQSRFLPLSLIAVGLWKNSWKNYFKTLVVSGQFSGFMLLITSGIFGGNVIALLYHYWTGNAVVLEKSPYLISILLAQVAFFGAALWCLQAGRRRIESILLGMMCLLWACLIEFAYFLSTHSFGTWEIWILRTGLSFLVIQGLLHIWWFVTVLDTYTVWKRFNLWSVLVLTMFLWGEQIAESNSFYTNGIVIIESGGAGAFLTLLWFLFQQILAVQTIGSSMFSQRRKRKHRYILSGILLLIISLLAGYTDRSSIAGQYPYALLFMIAAYALMIYVTHTTEDWMVSLVRWKRTKKYLMYGFIYAGFAVHLFTVLYLFSNFHHELIFNAVVPYGIPAALMIIFSCFGAILVLKKTQFPKETLMMGVVLIIFSFYGLEFLVNQIIGHYEWSLKIARIRYLMLALQLGVAIRFFLWLMDYKPGRLWLLLVYGLCGTLAITSQTPWLIVDIVDYPWGRFALAGPLYLPLELGVIVMLLSVTYTIYKNYHQMTMIRREQVIYILIGLGGAADLMLLDMPLVEWFQWYPPGNYAFLPILIMIYGFYRGDIPYAQSFFRKSLYWSGIFWLFYEIAFVLNMVNGQNTLQWYAQVIFVCFGGIYLFQSLWMRTVNLFLGHSRRYELNTRLRRLTSELSNARQLEDIFQSISMHLLAELFSMHCAVVFYNKKENSFDGWQKTNIRRSLFWEHQAKEDPVSLRHFPADLPLFSMLETYPMHRDTFRDFKQGNLDTHLSTGSLLKNTEWFCGIFSGETLVGIMFLGHKINGTHYLESEYEFLAHVCELLPPYIENASLVQNLESQVLERTHYLNQTLDDLKHKDALLRGELELASNIQQGIFPVLPLSHRDFRIDGYSRALGQVNGDYYEIIPMEDGSLYILIADAMGHGVPAAFITIMAKLCFSDILRHQNSPKAILRNFNQSMFQIIKTNEYLTAFLLKLSPDGRVIYSNASHPAAVILRHQTKTLEFWDTRGLFIGAMPDKDIGLIYEEQTSRLLPGDKVFLYTDGLIESENKNGSGEFWGEERVVKVLEQCLDLSLTEMKSFLQDKWTQFTGGHSRDDVTFLILEVNGP
ncbi:MAG: serine/threonine-protein phosphatase [SAR324 cluster bacterium]|nr:serine/threonine-protein phosphatase [SAR324 cluster bacterium]